MPSPECILFFSEPPAVVLALAVGALRTSESGGRVRHTGVRLWLSFGSPRAWPIESASGGRSQRLRYRGK